MPPHRVTTVVNVTFQDGEWDYDERVSLGGRRFRLIRVGVNGDAAAAEELVSRWAGGAAAIAISGVREARAAGRFSGRIDELQLHGAQVPVRDGALVTDVFQEWAIRRVEAEMPGYFANARVVVVGATTRERTIAVLREFTDNIVFDDPDHDLSLPGQLKTNPVTAAAAGLGEFAWRQIPGFFKHHATGPFGWVSDKVAHLAAESADVIIGSYSELMRFGLPHLAGKAVLTSTVSTSSWISRRSRSTSWSCRRCSRRWWPPPCPPAKRSPPTTSPSSSRRPDWSRSCCGPTAGAARAASRSSSTLSPPSTSRTSSRSAGSSTSRA